MFFFHLTIIWKIANVLVPAPTFLYQFFKLLCTLVSHNQPMHFLSILCSLPFLVPWQWLDQSISLDSITYIHVSRQQPILDHWKKPELHQNLVQKCFLTDLAHYDPYSQRETASWTHHSIALYLLQKTYCYYWSLFCLAFLFAGTPYIVEIINENKMCHQIVVADDLCHLVAILWNFGICPW